MIVGPPYFGAGGRGVVVWDEEAGALELAEALALAVALAEASGAIASALASTAASCEVAVEVDAVAAVVSRSSASGVGPPYLGVQAVTTVETTPEAAT